MNMIINNNNHAIDTEIKNMDSPVKLGALHRCADQFDWVR